LPVVVPERFIAGVSRDVEVEQGHGPQQHGLNIAACVLIDIRAPNVKNITLKSIAGDCWSAIAGIINTRINAALPN
jgi:hypothetical protein